MGSSFCEGYAEETCGACPRSSTQHPCWYRKVKVWQSRGGLHTPKERDPYCAPPRAPYGSWDQSIPTDSRGMPFLGPTCEPLTQKEISDLGGKFEKRRRELKNNIVQTGTITDEHLIS